MDFVATYFQVVSVQSHMSYWIKNGVHSLTEYIIDNMHKKRLNNFLKPKAINTFYSVIKKKQ